MRYRERKRESIQGGGGEGEGEGRRIRRRIGRHPKRNVKIEWPGGEEGMNESREKKGGG